MSLITSSPRKRGSSRWLRFLDSRPEGGKGPLPLLGGNDVLGFLLLLVLLPSLAFAADRTPKPSIVIDKPGKCVSDVETMRREHPDMLKHQRDQTMHKGIRTPRFSLNGCVECHASTKTGSVLGDQGFCQSCHAYAGVKLDCFECHAAGPKLAAGTDRGAKP